MKDLVFWPLITGISGGVIYYALQDIYKYPEKKRVVRIRKKVWLDFISFYYQLFRQNALHKMHNEDQIPS